MSKQLSMPYMFPPIALLPPQADAAGRSSSFRSLKWGGKTYIVCHVNQCNAATITLTPQQALDVSGTSAKAMSAAMPIWLVDATATSDKLIAQTPGLSFTTDATVADKIVIFEVVPEACMDTANGFATLNVSTGASNVANITEALLFVKLDYVSQFPPTTYSN